MRLARPGREQRDRCAARVRAAVTAIYLNPRGNVLWYDGLTDHLMHYAAWIARRWSDPAFPAAFPWFDTPRYWEDRILELREQTAAMQEAPLVA